MDNEHSETIEVITIISSFFFIINKDPYPPSLLTPPPHPTHTKIECFLIELQFVLMINPLDLEDNLYMNLSNLLWKVLMCVL